MARLGVGAVCVAVMTVALSGCVWVSGSPSFVLGYGPDPAAVQTGPGTLHLYSTMLSVNSKTTHIPSWTWTAKTDHSGGYHDALPSLPSWVGGVSPPETWAPTVRSVDGRFLMMFSASATPPSGQPLSGNCLAAATSSTAAGPFTPVDTFEMCDPDPTVGYFDPQLFNAPDGTVWLYWSRQVCSLEPGCGGTSSEIDAQQLSSDGLTAMGSPSVMVSYPDVESLNPDRPLGVVENPAMIANQQGSFELIMSLGYWPSPGYSTIDVPCTFPRGGCDPTQAQTLQLSGNSALPSGTGGASFATDAVVNGSVWIVFHGYAKSSDAGGTRAVYAETAVPFNPSPSAIPADIAAEHAHQSQIRLPVRLP